MGQYLHLLFSMVLCLTVLNASAQPHRPWPTYGISVPQPQPHSGKKQPAPPQRLLAYANYRYDGSVFRTGDSTVYIYTGGNVWDTAFGIWKFSTTVQHDDDARGDFVLNPEIRTTHNYNGSGQVTLVQRELITGTGSNVLDQAKYTYNSNKLVRMELGVQHRHLPAFYGKEYLYTHDLLGRLTGVLTADIGSGPVNATQRDFFYDSTWAISDECFSTGIKNGSIAALMALDSTHHTYINGNRTESFTRRKNSSGVFVGYQHRMYQYDSNNRLIKDYTLEWNYFKISSWDTMVESTYTYDASGHNTMTTILSRYQNTIPQRFHKTYDSLGQILTNAWEVWDSTTLAWKYDSRYSNEERFYYGVNNLGINDKPDQSTTISLYPIPASNNITLDINTKEKQLYIAICALDGRLVRTWNQPLFGNQYRETIDLSGIAAGNYMLHVQSAGGQITKQFSVVR